MMNRSKVAFDFVNSKHFDDPCGEEEFSESLPDPFASAFQSSVFGTKGITCVPKSPVRRPQQAPKNLPPLLELPPLDERVLQDLDTSDGDFLESPKVLKTEIEEAEGVAEELELAKAESAVDSKTNNTGHKLRTIFQILQGDNPAAGIHSPILR